MKAGVEGSVVREAIVRFSREVRDGICVASEALDGGRFAEHPWRRDGGGGGVTRVLQDGAVFEKAGVNVSAVWGTLDPQALARMSSRRGGVFFDDLADRPAGELLAFVAECARAFVPACLPIVRRRGGVAGRAPASARVGMRPRRSAARRRSAPSLVAGL